MNKLKYNYFVDAFKKKEEEYVMYIAYYLAEHPETKARLDKLINKFNKKGA